MYWVSTQPRCITHPARQLALNAPWQHILNPLFHANRLKSEDRFSKNGKNQQIQTGLIKPLFGSAYPNDTYGQNLSAPPGRRPPQGEHEALPLEALLTTLL